MNLTGIIAISGKPGLFKVVAQGKNNLIVESLEDGKRFPAYSTDRISALEDISVYTYDEDVALGEIFEIIYSKENGGEAPSHKSDKLTLENYTLEILPSYDQERVYLSDLKKIYQWYNLLHKSGLLVLTENETAQVDEAVIVEENTDSSIEEKPKAKRAPRKKAVKSEE